MVGLVKSIYHCNVCIRTLPEYSSLLSPVSRPQPRFPQCSAWRLEKQPRIVDLNTSTATKIPSDLDT